MVRFLAFTLFLFTSFSNWATEPEESNCRSAINNLPKNLDWKTAFKFPIATPEARWDLFVGGSSLFLGPIGWVLNLGHRLEVVRRLSQSQQPFNSFFPLAKIFGRGFIAVSAITGYLSPAGGFAIASHFAPAPFAVKFAFGLASFFSFSLGVFTLPGAMTVYGVSNDARILLRPIQAFNRALEKRKIYAKAWKIALSAITLSGVGALLGGVGFFYSSVWAWQVIGYAFTIAMYSDGKSTAKSSISQ